MTSKHPIRAYAEARGMTINAVLTDMAGRGLKLKQMAAEFGCTPAAVCKMMQRHGVKHGILVDGVRATMKAHCHRIGADVNRAYLARHKRGISKAEAIEVARP